MKAKVKLQKPEARAISPARIRRAARHLRRVAAELEDSYTLGGVWLTDPESQRIRREVEDQRELGRDLVALAAMAIPRGR